MGCSINLEQGPLSCDLYTPFYSKLVYMEASQVSELDEKNNQLMVSQSLSCVLESGGADRSSRASRWSKEETVTLVLVKREYEDDVAMMTKRGQMINKDLKWNQISEMCALRGVHRNSPQCRKRWQDTICIYKKIKDWETRNGGRDSYWAMSAPGKKHYKLPTMFEKEVFDELDKFMKSRPRLNAVIDDSDISENFPSSHDDEQGHHHQHGSSCDVSENPQPYDVDEESQHHPSLLGRFMKEMQGVNLVVADSDIPENGPPHDIDDQRSQHHHLSSYGVPPSNSFLGRFGKSRPGISPMVGGLDVAENHMSQHDGDDQGHQQHLPPYNSVPSSSRESVGPPSTGKRKRQSNASFNEVEHWTKVLKENTAAVIASNDRANQLIEKQTETMVSVFQQINMTMKSLIDRL